MMKQRFKFDSSALAFLFVLKFQPIIGLKFQDSAF